MPTNEGAYRQSGRYGEAFFIDPAGKRPPLKIFEATALTFTKELEVTDVPLSGNRTGTKDGAEQPGTFNLNLAKIDNFFENIVREAFNQNLAARRAARDAGVRINRTFTLQVWEDDPDALGAVGHQLEECRLSIYMGGYDYGDAITNREHTGRFESFTVIQSFERIGNQVDPATGLPAIKFTEKLGS